MTGASATSGVRVRGKVQGQVQGQVQGRGTGRRVSPRVAFLAVALVFGALSLAVSFDLGGGGPSGLEIADTADAAAVPLRPSPVDTAGSDDDAHVADAPDADAPDADDAPGEDGPDGGDPPGPAPAGAAAGDLEVYFLDVGQGDATLLRHAEATILIDTGRHQASDVVPYLRSAGVGSLDLLVITHPHADHIGQFDQVVDTLPVTEVWWPGSTTTSQTFERAVGALERSDAAYEEPRAGDTALIGPLEVEVVNPPAGVALRDLHDAGIALRITYGEVRLLFTGDAEAATEARMARSGAALRADILQLGHHGSSTSTTPGFLAAVDPAVAIYSASATNQYGHPHAEVLQRLDAAGVEVYGTAVHGTVTVTTDGVGWVIGTERRGTPP